MRKVFVAAALCAVAIVAVAAVSGAAAKGKPKLPGKVSVLLTPNNQVVPPATKPSTTNVTVVGKLKTRPACRSSRTIRFTYITPAGVYDLTETATTGSNGSFTATLPRPKDTSVYKDKLPNTITVSASTDRLSRTDKSTGEKVVCLDASGINDFTVS
jgi:hypothetical protein